MSEKREENVKVGEGGKREKEEIGRGKKSAEGRNRVREASEETDVRMNEGGEGRKSADFSSFVHRL